VLRDSKTLDGITVGLCDWIKIIEVCARSALCFPRGLVFFLGAARPAGLPLMKLATHTTIPLPPYNTIICYQQQTQPDQKVRRVWREKFTSRTCEHIRHRSNPCALGS
jgi:hypothetical protein